VIGVVGVLDGRSPGYGKQVVERAARLARPPATVAHAVSDYTRSSLGRTRTLGGSDPGRIALAILVRQSVPAASHHGNGEDAREGVGEVGAVIHTTKANAGCRSSSRASRTAYPRAFRALRLDNTSDRYHIAKAVHRTPTTNLSACHATPSGSTTASTKLRVHARPRVVQNPVRAVDCGRCRSRA
jgi:hypothetical protein